jgi:hypothetical protein
MAGEPAVHEERESSSGARMLGVSFVVPGAGRPRVANAFASNPDTGFGAGPIHRAGQRDFIDAWNTEVIGPRVLGCRQPPRRRGSRPSDPY